VKINLDAVFFLIHTSSYFSVLAVSETNVTLLNLVQEHGSKYGLAEYVDAPMNLKMERNSISSSPGFLILRDRR
jgi:hypothetical protein